MTLLEEIREYIAILSPPRARHTLGVEKAALMLKDNHFPQLDAEKVSAAALLHDCTKELSAEEQLETAERLGVLFSPEELDTPKLRHAVTGAATARCVFGLGEDVSDAILYHTTARADMSPLEKILYLADFIDENRSDELCTDVRAVYFSFWNNDRKSALDRTLLYALDRSIEILKTECKRIHPHTIEARNFLKRSLADEDNLRRDKQ